MYPILIVLAITELALVLVSTMPRRVTLLLRRITPRWVDRVTFLLQVAVLVGELAFMISFIAPGWLVVLLASLVAALFPGNPISDSAVLWSAHLSLFTATKQCQQ